MPQSDLMDGIVAASVPFIIESEAVMPGCYLALLGGTPLIYTPRHCDCFNGSQYTFGVALIIGS